MRVGSDLSVSENFVGVNQAGDKPPIFRCLRADLPEMRTLIINIHQREENPQAFTRVDLEKLL